MASIDSIEGIGSSYANTLNATGIASVEALLEAACEKNSRSKLAAKTGISEKLILKWVNMADLFRVRGVGRQYAELLERAGVDTSNNGDILLFSEKQNVPINRVESSHTHRFPGTAAR